MVVIGALAPIASSDSPSGKGNGNGNGARAAGQVAPGQAKKAAGTPSEPAVATAASTPATQAPGQAKKTASRPLPATAQAPQSRTAAPASSARAQRPTATTPPAAPSTQTAPPAPVATAPPAAAPPPPAPPPAPPAATPARSQTTRQPGRGRNAARTPAAAASTSGAAPSRAATSAAGDTPTLADVANGTAPTSAKPRTSQDEGEAGPSSPLRRTVVHVLEVVPTWMRIALAALAGLAVLLGAAVFIQTRRRRRLERQRSLLLQDVGLLQSALLPDLPERIGGARVSAAYRPAEGLAAGGDFYDAFELPGGRTAVLVGDVAGHGRDAVPLTALVRYNLRAYLEAGLSPRAAIHVAGTVLESQLPGRQVTIVVAIFDPGTGRLTYSCAGHWPPLLLGVDTTQITVCSSPPIGAGAATGRRQTTIALPPGATACFHTDGLDEARCRGDRAATARRLGRDGVADELRAIGDGADATALIERVARRCERQTDDMAACMITALPTSAARWSLQLEELEVDRHALASGWAARFLHACGVGVPRIARALREADAIIDRAGTAVVEVRFGEALAAVRVSPPPAVSLPIERRTSWPVDAAATG